MSDGAVETHARKGVIPMKAVVRNQSALAYPSDVTPIQRESTPQSPEQSASATSGTYFRAVRPTEAEAAALSRGEPVIDCAKVERLCSTIRANMWRADAQVIAQRMLDDASDSPSAASSEVGDVAANPDEDRR
jgi:anti-sigma28 factor (negative regulator of flagellin synthesis)